MSVDNAIVIIVDIDVAGENRAITVGKVGDIKVGSGIVFTCGAQYSTSWNAGRRFLSCLTEIAPTRTAPLEENHEGVVATVPGSHGVLPSG